jgi:hypothetical protein
MRGAGVHERCGISRSGDDRATLPLGPTGMVSRASTTMRIPSSGISLMRKSSCADARYLDRVAARSGRRFALLAERAAARCSFGFGIEDKVAFNRLPDEEQSHVHAPRQGNPDIVEVAGPVDPQVGVIGVWR